MSGARPSDPTTALAPILLVEDTRDDVYFFQRAMAKVGATFGLLVASSGLEAISYLAGTDGYSDRTRFPMPKLLLLDLKLPGATGLEVLEWIRKTSLLQTLKVVMLTSSSVASDVARAYELGASLYLVKPGGQDALRKLVRGLHSYWKDPDEDARKQLAPFLIPDRG